MKVKKYIVIFLVISMSLMGCTQIGMKEYTKNIFALNTYITLTAYGGRNTPKILDKAVQRIQEIENHMSTEIDTSDVALINKNAGESPVEVHDDTFYVIERALWYCNMSDGAFDITIYPIVKLWDITGDNPRVPDEEEIQRALSLVDYTEVILDREDKTVFLNRSDMGIDLGAIAKGYAADEVVRILEKSGIRHGLLNLGGNISVIGDKPDGTPWNIGVRDPREEETQLQYLAIASISNSSIVSSGDYERYIKDVYEKTGIRYHHIFDPRTGYPADSGLIGTTVIAKDSIDADALSTCLFIMGQERGLKFLQNVQGSKGICIDNTKRIYTSSGMDNILEITGEEYRLEK